MKTVKLGIIGCGVIGWHHIKAAAQAEMIDLVAIADLRREIAQELADQYNVPTIYTEGEALLADEQIDAVVLAMPACYRKDLALRAFALGKHVLTEKPVAMNADEVREMIAAKGDLVAACCSSRYQFIESTKIVATFIATGALGDLRVIRCRAINPATPPSATPPPIWRLNRSINGGGIMSNWGCYDLDYLLGITGWSLQPQSVLAQTWTVPTAYESTHAAPNSDAETHLVALIRCAGGAAITYERGEFLAAKREASWEIIGEKGSLTLQMVNGPDKVILHHQVNTAEGLITEILWAGEEDAALVHSGPVTDFAQAILTRKEPQTSLERALRVQAITDGIYASAERGEAVRIDGI